MGAVMRRWVFLGGGVLVLVGVLLLGWGLWQREGGDVEKERVWRGFRGAARGQDFYVAQEVLAQEGVVLVAQRGRLPLALADYDVVVLGGAGGAVSADEFADWLAVGGRLVVVARGNELLLEAFGGGFEFSSAREVCGEAWHLRWQAGEGVALFPEGEVEGWVELLGAQEALGVGWACEGVAFARIKAVGNGAVVALGHDLAWWSNEVGYGMRGRPADLVQVPVAMGDNMAYLRAVLGEGRRVLWLSEGVGEVRRVGWDFVLARQWWALAVAGAVALGLLLWRFGRRFGSLLLEQRQQVDEWGHLQAAGNYWVSVGGYEWLALEARRRLAGDFRLFVRRMGGEDRALEWLVERCGLDRGRVAMLCGVEGVPVVEGELDFVRFMQDVECLRRLM